MAGFLNDILGLDLRKHLGNKISDMSIPSKCSVIRRIQKDPKGSFDFTNYIQNAQLLDGENTSPTDESMTHDRFELLAAVDEANVC